MVEQLAGIAESTERDNDFLGRGILEQRLSELASADDSLPVRDRVRLLTQIGDLQARHGEFEAAIATLEGAVASIPPDAAHAERVTWRPWYVLGVAYLRWGEVQNCICDHCAASCILPFAPEAVHRDRRGSEGAMRCFREVLQRNSDHVESRWLLNLAAMTLGDHPRGIEKEHRISRRVFTTGSPFPSFQNEAAARGLSTYNLSGGAALEDFDGDDDLDLLTSTFDTHDNIRYLRNDGGSFVDATEEAGLIGILGGLNLVQGDFDGDGWIDAYVLRGAWLRENGRHPNSLLRNLGGGRFVDVTRSAGLAEVSYPTQTAAFADYDLDGDLDLYVGNEARGPRQYPNQLFQNQGDGTFVDVAAEAGVEDLRFTKGVVWGDFDQDRYPDLYVSNLSDENRLYRNRGDGTFEDVALDLGLTGPLLSFPAWFWDYDNDGALDLFVANYVQDLGTIARSWIDGTPSADIPALYRGNGEGGFEDVAAALGLDRTLAVMGSNYGDVDYDGFPDFYLGTGYPGYEALMPNLMYHNEGGRAFADVTVKSRTGHLQKGHAVAFGDVDQDGDQDIFEQLGGAFLGDKFHDAFFANPGFGNHRVIVQLIGTRSNRHGVGCRLRVDLGGKEAPRTVYAHVHSGGSFGARSLRQEIGLGDATRIDRLEVHWPASDLRQIFVDVPADHLLRITEGSEVPESIPLVPVGQ